MAKINTNKLGKFLLEEFDVSDISGGTFENFDSAVRFSGIRNLHDGEERFIFIKKLGNGYRHVTYGCMKSGRKK